MPEEENVEATGTVPDENDTPDQQKPTETVEFWKQKAREQEKRAKDNAAAAKRLAEFEEAQKTESQRLTDQLAAESSRADAAETELMRYKVATEKGVPANAMKFLAGSTLEEIEASAKDVLELIGDAGKPRTPKPDPNQGRQKGEVSDPATQFAAIMRQQLDNA